MDKLITKDTLAKAVLYEANQLENLLSKAKDRNDKLDAEENLKTLQRLIDFFVDTSPYWRYKVEIEPKKSKPEDIFIFEMTNWLQNHNIPYIRSKYFNTLNDRYTLVFTFIREEDAASFKLRFLE